MRNEGQIVPDNFLALPQESTDLKKAPFVVLPVPYEATTTFKKGTRYGPAALIQASAQVELFDEEVWDEPWKDGVHTAPVYNPSVPVEAFLKGLRDEVARHVAAGKFVISLGGEHTIAEAPVAAYAAKHKDLSILQFDAHADMRPEYEGSVYNHACAAHRMSHFAPIVQVGVRNVGETEQALLNKGRVRTFLMHETLDFRKHYDAILDALSDTVYITFDLDALDPGIMPGVGTPVPGGLSWFDATHLIRECVTRKRVVGADVNELCPLVDSVVSEFTAARLAYKIIAYEWDKRRRTKKKKGAK